MATGMKIDLARLRGSIKNKRELAKKLGISRNSLYRKLNGRARLYWEELNRICFYLDTDAKSFWSECPMYIPCMTKADKIQIYKVIEERKRLIVQNEKGDATFYEAPHETEEGAWYFLIENNFLWDNQLMGKEIARRIREGIVERKAKFPSPHTSLPVYVKVFAQLNYVSVVWGGTDPEFPQLEIFPDTEYLLGSEANKKRLLEALNSKEEIPLEVVRERIGF